MATTYKPITHEKVHRAKMSIENFYSNLINQYQEREERLEITLVLFLFFEIIFNHRYRRLEETMKAEGLSEQEVKS